MSIEDTLAEYVAIINAHTAHGPDSRQAEEFLAQNQADTEFSELAAIARALKLVLKKAK